MNALRWACLGVLLAVGTVAAQPPADKGPLIGEVIVRNNRIVPTPKITNAIQSRVGQPYSQATASADIGRIMALQAFTDVKISLQTASDGKLIVFYDVVELPSVVREIKYDGAKHLKDDELDAVTGLHRGVPLNPIANRLAVNAIIRKYNDDGRLYAHVELIEGMNPGDTRVVFRITEGPEVKVGNVSFRGNSFVSGERLRTQINTSRSLVGFGGKYTPAMTEFDAGKLVEYYRTYGYHDARVDKEVIQSADGRTVDIVFHIDEGPQYRIKAVQVTGQQSFTEDRIISVTKLKPGDKYDRNVVQADLKNVKDLYGYTGRLVTPREQLILSGPGEVTVQYELQERPPARVGQVQIIGNEVTRDNVIRRQIPLVPGQILTYPDIERSNNNLARLNIFEMNAENGVRPTVTVIDPDGENPLKDILVQVQETQTGSLLFGVGVNSDAGLSGSIVLNERNFDILRPPTSIDEILAGRAFRGAGQEFRLEAVPGTQTQRYSASFREPSFRDGPYSLGVSGYYYTRGYAEYNEERLGGRVSVGRRLNPLWTANATVRVENVNLYDIPSYFPTDITKNRGDNFLAGFRGSLQRDSRDSYLRPTEGSMFEAGYEQVTGDYNFPIFTAEYSKFFTTYQRPDGSGRHVLSMKSQLAMTSSDAPVFERFYAGGFRSMRGFEFRGVGPFINNLNVGGEFSFLNSVEYQIPLVASDQLYAVGFIDSGSVERNIEIKDYRVTAGLGLRIVVPMLGPVPVALDFGVPIVRGPDDRKQLFSFWLGFFN